MRHWMLIGLVGLIGVGCGATGEPDDGLRVTPRAGIRATDVREAVYDVNLTFRATAPAGAKKLRGWFVLPLVLREQRATEIKVSVRPEVPHRIVEDSRGNRLVYIEQSRPRSMIVQVRCVLRRKEVAGSLEVNETRPYNRADLVDKQQWLQPSRHVVIDTKIKDLAASVVGQETNPIRMARCVYDWMLNNVQHRVKDPGKLTASGVGSSAHCLARRAGDAADMHALFAAIARAAGVPTRIVYGSMLGRGGEGRDEPMRVHCWAEFHAPNLGWVPVDVALGDIFVGDFAGAPDEKLLNRVTPSGYAQPDPEKVDYYFGRIDERRVTFTTGRDIQLDPKQSAGALTSMTGAYLEIDGKPFSGWTGMLTYRER